MIIYGDDSTCLGRACVRRPVSLESRVCVCRARKKKKSSKFCHSCEMFQDLPSSSFPCVWPHTHTYRRRKSIARRDRQSGDCVDCIWSSWLRSRLSQLPRAVVVANPSGPVAHINLCSQRLFSWVLCCVPIGADTLVLLCLPGCLFPSQIKTGYFPTPIVELCHVVSLGTKGIHWKDVEYLPFFFLLLWWGGWADLYLSKKECFYLFDAGRFSSLLAGAKQFA